MKETILTTKNELAVKRVDYFDRQFLTVDEFKDEQKYHSKRLERHNVKLHSSGVVDGFSLLKAETAAGTLILQIGTGIAIDDDGRELYIPEGTYIEGKFPNTTLTGAKLYIMFNEEGTSPYLYSEDDEVDKMTRKAEIPLLLVNPKSTAKCVFIGTLANAGATTVLDNKDVAYVNAKLDHAIVSSLTFRNEADKEHWPVFISDKENSVTSTNAQLKLIVDSNDSISLVPQKMMLEMQGTIGGKNSKVVLKKYNNSESKGISALNDMAYLLGTDGGILAAESKDKDGNIVEKPVITWDKQGCVGINTAPINLGEARGLHYKSDRDAILKITATKNVDKEESLSFDVRYGHGVSINTREGQCRLELLNSRVNNLFGDETNIEGKLITGDIDVSGNLDVKGSLKVSNSLNVTGNLNANCITRTYICKTTAGIGIGDVVSIYAEKTSRMEALNTPIESLGVKTLDINYDNFIAKSPEILLDTHKEIFMDEIPTDRDTVPERFEVVKSTRTLDRNVCGVVVSLNKRHGVEEYMAVNVAYSGIVAFCKVDAKLEQVEIGSALVTSSYDGFARPLAATEKDVPAGVFIGKAMKKIALGNYAVIPVLLTLG